MFGKTGGKVSNDWKIQAFSAARPPYFARRRSDRARSPAANVNATVTWVKVETVPGTLGVPVKANGDPIDHIQFRYVDYVTSFSGGTSSPPCPLTRVDCAGVTQLWR